MSELRPSLTHIALQVQDLDATIEFYSTYCGLQVVHDRRDRSSRVVWLAESGRAREFILVLIPWRTGAHAG